MSYRANPLKVGVFVLAALALFFAAVLTLGAGALLDAPFLAETYLNESVQGLAEGSPVKHRGTQIGTVSEITFVRREYTSGPDDPIVADFGRFVVVRMEITQLPFRAGLSAEQIRRAIAREIEQGLRARLATAGITGLAYIEVDYVDAERNPALELPWTPPPSVYVIPSAPSTITRFVESADQFFRSLEGNDLGSLAEHTDQFVVRLTQMLDEAQVQRFADEIAALVRELTELAASVRARVESDEVERMLSASAETSLAVRDMAQSARDELPALLADMRAGSTSLRNVAAELEQAAGSADVDRAVATLGASAESVSAALAELPDAVRALRVTLQRLDLALAGGRADMGQVARNLRLITDNLRDLTEVARVYPSLMLFGEPPAPGGKD